MILPFKPPRPLSYTNVDLFLLCFALDSPSSLNNVLTKWSPDLRRHARRVPTILVGLKKDLRVEGEGEENEEGKNKFVTHHQGRKMASEISSLRF